MSKMRDLPQTKKAKKMYYSPIIDLLLSPDGKSKTKAELMEKLNCGDRVLRRTIAECSCYYPILALSNQTGYRRVRDIETLTDEELKKEYEEVEHQIEEYKSRIDCLRKKQHTLIKWVKMAEKLRGDILCQESK